jgi:hypothetical protein
MFSKSHHFRTPTTCKQTAKTFQMLLEMDLEDKHLPYYHLIQQYIMYLYDLGKDSECEKTDCLGGEVLDEVFIGPRLPRQMTKEEI